RVDLDLVAQRVLDRFALKVLVCIAGIGAVSAEPSVQRPARVDVSLAEIRVAVGIPLRERGDCGNRQYSRAKQRSRHGAASEMKRIARFHIQLPLVTLDQPSALLLNL